MRARNIFTFVRADNIHAQGPGYTCVNVRHLKPVGRAVKGSSLNPKGAVHYYLVTFLG